MFWKADHFLVTVAVAFVYFSSIQPLPFPFGPLKVRDVPDLPIPISSLVSAFSPQVSTVEMGRYAREPDNATKSAKARGSNLRVHFKVTKREGPWPGEASKAALNGKPRDD